MAKRCKIGDVFELRTRKGLAYVQATHKVPAWGHLLRVLPGLFDTRPAEVCSLTPQTEQFVTFFPVQAALQQEILTFVANCVVPPHATQLPLFRAPGWSDRSGKVLDWWLWDGAKSWKIGELKPEQRKFPIKEVINDTLLIERIEEGWTPENDRD